MKFLTTFVVLFATSFAAFGYETRYKSTEIKLRSLAVGVNLFEIDIHRYPKTSEGLAALTSRPSGISSNEWHGPYWNAEFSSLKDEWGRHYVYICPGIHNTNGFDLYSRGADGMSKTGGNDPDDINNWDSSHHWDEYYTRPTLTRPMILYACGAMVAVSLAIIWFATRASDKREDLNGK